MDIDQEFSSLLEKTKPVGKTNIIVIGGKRNGKTTMINTLLDFCNAPRQTYFLINSVKIWESNFSFQEEDHNLRLIEMDIEPKVLNHKENFENFLAGGRNYLCFIINNTDASFSKHQSRILQFFDKFTHFTSLFTGCAVVWNHFNMPNKKKETSIPFVDYEKLIYHEVKLDSLFQNLVFFDFSSPHEILNYFLSTVQNTSQNVEIENYQSNPNLLNCEKREIYSNNQLNRDIDMNMQQKMLKNDLIEKKIFKISKIKKNKKVNCRNQFFNEEKNIQVEGEITNLAVNNLNESMDSETDSVTVSSRMNPNSLISISREVYSYLREMVESKGSSVTEYILKQLKKSQTNLSFKNIQRRVYDAINVMAAVGILHKEKNNLFFKGRMNSAMNSRGISSRKTSRNRHHTKFLRERIREKKITINSKQYELIGLCSKYHLSQKLVSLNKNDSKRKITSEKLGYPFTLIKTTNDANFVIKQDDFNSRLCILSDKPYDIIYEEQIVKMLLKDDVKNVRNGLKVKIAEEPYDYMIRHSLLEKYFNNMSNFNTNNLSLREGFNTFNTINIQKSPVYGLDNTYIQNSDNNKKQSIDFLIRKAFADEGGSSSISNYDMMGENNFNNFSNNPFDFSDRNDFMESGLGTNQISTNFFSKFLRNSDEKN